MVCLISVFLWTFVRFESDPFSAYALYDNIPTEHTNVVIDNSTNRFLSGLFFIGLPINIIELHTEALVIRICVECSGRLIQLKQMIIPLVGVKYASHVENILGILKQEFDQINIIINHTG